MLDKFMKKEWNPILFRVVAAIGFVLIMLVLYFGSINFIFKIKSSWIMFVLWTLWWPFLYVSLLLLGRFWCGFICPIGLFNEVGNSIRNAKRDFLLKYAWIPFVVFFLIVFWEQVSGLFFSTKVTLLFLRTFFVFALLIGIILPRWGFCKHFCPIGTLFGLFSRLSILSVRTDQNICEVCESKECIKGGKYPACPMFNDVPNLESNKDCLVCANCIKNCPHNSAKLCFVKPGKELKKKSGFNISESLFIIALLGFAMVLTTRGTNLVRFFEVTGALLRGLDFIFGIVIFIILYFILTFISIFIDKSKRKSFKKDLIEGGYVFLPLVFSLMFFLIIFGFISPLTEISELLIAISKYIILGLGAIWSIKIAKNFDRKAWVYIGSIILIVLLWVLVLIPGPLSLVSDKENIYFAEHGEVVDMKAFSMGFDPSIIKIESGGYFDLNLSNMDIVHSFDIDDLNVHVNLHVSDNKIVRINVVEKGEFEFFCAIPGHKEAGMKGMLIVE